MPITPADLKAVADASEQVSTWALAAIAATVLAVVSGSYRRPVKLQWRLPYLLFVPAWILLSATLYFGNKITGSYVAAQLVSDDKLPAIAAHTNTLYLSQQQSFLAALGILALWLVSYLVGWIFFDIVNDEKEDK